MIEKSGLVNKVFTLDALLCSQKTTRTIIESKNDYLIPVKKNQIKLYDSLKKYPHFHCVISVKRKGWREIKEGNEVLYYISSKKLPTQIFAEKIQQHWEIKNQVHWVKDVIFQEDNSRIKDCVVAKKTLC